MIRVILLGVVFLFAPPARGKSVTRAKTPLSRATEHHRLSGPQDLARVSDFFQRVERDQLEHEVKILAKKLVDTEEVLRRNHVTVGDLAELGKVLLSSFPFGDHRVAKVEYVFRVMIQNYEKARKK